MIRKFNYTGRQKIPAESVEIELLKDPDGVPGFLPRLSLDLAAAPAEARVYVEAYSRFGYERFDVGTLGRLEPPKTRWLPELSESPTIRFRVKVVDERERHGRILAVAEAIDPIDPADAGRQRLSLLPVQAADLGQLVWRLEFEQDGPVLLVNRRIDGVFSLVGSDAAFQALVLPAVLRQVLAEVLMASVDADPWAEDDWQALWLQFAMRFNPVEPPSGLDTPGSERAAWIDTAVEGFCEWARSCDVLQNSRAARSEER